LVAARGAQAKGFKGCHELATHRSSQGLATSVVGVGAVVGAVATAETAVAAAVAAALIRIIAIERRRR
jgi:hypothetical protein